MTLSYATQASRPGPRMEWMEYVWIVGGLMLFAVLILAIIVPRPKCGRGPRVQRQFCEAAIGDNGPIVAAIARYCLHAGRLPTSLRQLTQRPSHLRAKEWPGPYIADPTGLKDPWGEPYQYRCPGADGRAFDLWSKGPDKEDGTDDDITSWPGG